MDSVHLGLPQLTAEELANPHTRITINGITVHLWQVAHLYGVQHNIPRPGPANGASASDFRRLHASRHDAQAASPGPLTSLTDATTGGLPPAYSLTDSPTLPSSSSTSTRPQLPGPHGASRDTFEMRNLFRILDELVDECWPDGSSSQGGAGQTRTVRAGTALGTKSLTTQPPLWPPPAKPLPPLPIQAPLRCDTPTPKRKKAFSAAPDSVTVRRRISPGRTIQISRKNERRQLREARPVTPTISPPNSVRTGTSPSEGSVATARPDQPSTTYPPRSTAFVAASLALSAEQGANAHLQHHHDSGFPECQLNVSSGTQTEHSPFQQRQLHPSQSPRRNLPVPHLLSTQAQHTGPWQFSILKEEQQPTQGPGTNPQLQPGVHSPTPNCQQQRGRVPGRNPFPGITRPATPLQQVGAALQSRWSPDSSPEDNAIKKVKRVFSFARLRRRS